MVNMRNKLATKAGLLRRKLMIKRLRLVQIPPNYAFFNKFEQNDVAVDIGVGDDPDFSKHLINNYGLDCFGVDPTRKHTEVLRKVEKDMANFHFLPLAVGPNNGHAKFFESHDNISGSLLKNHTNIINDHVSSYEVDMITLDELIHTVNKKVIAIMKIDIEGAEYAVIDKLESPTLKRVQQLIVEFHHDTVREYTSKNTREAIKRINALGMKSFVYNGRDCLFY
ncbi:MAG: FkbM family methyltransferase [Actinomycetia bacterium]|nr:FkbM family methyltransferase [Actinomycetes bacterium]